MALHAKQGANWTLIRALHVRENGSWLQVKRAFVRVEGVWRPYFQAEVVVTLAASVSPIIKNYFTAAVWADPLIRKVVEVPAGVEIGANYLGHALATSDSASGQAGSWAGELIINIRGVISGIGGAINSGVGGNAFLVTYRGRNGELATINNYGTMRAGGGGGGLAGNGGAGQYPYTFREPASGWLYQAAHTSWLDTPVQNPPAVRWGGNLVGYAPAGSTAHTVGDWTYLKGPQWSVGAFQIARQQTRQAASAGGISGNAGRGQGFDGAATAGSNPVAGGSGAGASGKSGNGGGWGQPGQAGAAGANGNVGNGTAGAAAGLAGFYLTGAANCNFNNYGTALGRVA